MRDPMHPTHVFAAGALALAVVAAPAAAADLRFGSLDGWAVAGYATGNHAARDTAFLSGDVTFAAPLFGSALGIELGGYGLAYDLDTPHETYGALTLATGFGRLSAGVVRPAFDRFAASPLDRMLPLAGFAEPRIAATRSRVTWGAMYAGYLPYGASLTGGNDAFGWAVSAHRAESQNLTVASLGLGLSRPGWRLDAAVEWASDDSWAGKAQMVSDGPQVSAGLGLYAAPAPHHANRAEGWLTWHQSPRLDLSALVQVPTEGHGIGVLAADYSLGDHARLALGLSDEAGTAAASLGLDWRF